MTMVIVNCHGRCRLAMVGRWASGVSEPRPFHSAISEPMWRASFGLLCFPAHVVDISWLELSWLLSISDREP